MAAGHVCYRSLVSVVALFSAAANIGCSDAGSPSPPGGSTTNMTTGRRGGSAAGTSVGGGTNPSGGDTSTTGGMATTGGTGGAGAGGSGGSGKIGDPNLDGIVPLYDATTVLEQAIIEDTPTALITRFAD